jgi:nucleoside-diphosphate-sugar epimerase
MTKKLTTRNKILITGGNGLLGKQLISSLSEQYDVYAILRKKPTQQFKGVQYLYIDLSTQWDTSILPDDIDIIIHLAQSSKFRDFPNGGIDIFNVNIKSTALLLDYASKNNVKKFIYASSGGIYSAESGKAFNESSPIATTDKLGYYLGSKLCGEVLVRNYSTIFYVTTLRFFFMYGPEQNKTMLIPRLIERVNNSEKIILKGHNGIKINPIYVDDAKNAVLNAMLLNESYVLNIGGAEIKSIREIAEIIGDTFGKKPIFEIVDDEAKNIIGDITGMKNKLYTPKINLLDGIKNFTL